MMKSVKIFSAFAFCLYAMPHTALAQNFRSEQRKLEAAIHAAYKNKRVTALEYSKLKEEQGIIKTAIARSDADGVMTPDEKNKLHAKLMRARKRLAKYKTNREIY